MQRRKLFGSIAASLLFGSMALISTLSRPRTNALHNVDILSLLAAGACFGVALTVLLMFLRGGPQANR